MKHLKMLGLAAIAALGLMAFVGAGTASATTLFTDSAKTIKYPAGTTIQYSLKSGTSAKLTSPTGTAIFTCTSLSADGTIVNDTGTGVSDVINSWLWGNCSQEVLTVSTGSLEIQWTSGSSGQVIGRGSQWTFPMFGVSCTYGTGEGTLLGTITGGEAPVLSISTNIVKTAGGFLCPSTPHWDAELVITAPHALYTGS